MGYYKIQTYFLVPEINTLWNFYKEKKQAISAAQKMLNFSVVEPERV